MSEVMRMKTIMSEDENDYLCHVSTYMEEYLGQVGIFLTSEYVAAIEQSFMSAFLDESVGVNRKKRRNRKEIRKLTATNTDLSLTYLHTYLNYISTFRE